MNVDRTEALEAALEIALITLAGLMGDGEFEESETIKYLQRVLEDDGDYSVED